MRKIFSIEEIDSTVIKEAVEEVYTLVKEELKITSKLVTNNTYNVTYEEFKQSELYKNLFLIFEIAQSDNKGVYNKKIHKKIDQVLDLLFSQRGNENYVIPDGFWRTSLGYCIQIIRFNNYPKGIELISTEKAAEILNISAVHVTRLIKQGRLSAQRVGRSYALLKGNVLEFEKKTRKGD
ncbi:MAG: helix-turn-helix domain-containing protein [bacterium]